VKLGGSSAHAPKEPRAEPSSYEAEATSNSYPTKIKTGKVNSKQKLIFLLKSSQDYSPQSKMSPSPLPHLIIKIKIESGHINPNLKNAYES
jgi:hypothetical protein